jgi:hypothetical protein
VWVRVWVCVYVCVTCIWIIWYDTPVQCLITHFSAGRNLAAERMARLLGFLERMWSVFVFVCVCVCVCACHRCSW